MIRRIKEDDYSLLKNLFLKFMNCIVQIDQTYI